MQHLKSILATAVLILAILVSALAMPARPASSQGPPADQGCVTRRNASGASAAAGRSSFDLAAQYVFDVTQSTTAGWTVGRDGRAGKRLSFLLPRNSITICAEPSLIPDRAAKRHPMIWLNRNGVTEPFTYTLVAVGNPDVLLGLQMKRSSSLSEILPNLPTKEQVEEARRRRRCPVVSRVPVQNLAAAHAISATLQAELVARDGTFVPITVDQIDFQPDAEMLRYCGYNDPGFVVLAPSYTGWQNHHLYMVLDRNVAGPPEEGWSVMCTRWQAGNWWTRFLSALYGC